MIMLIIIIIVADLFDMKVKSIREVELYVIWQTVLNCLRNNVFFKNQNEINFRCYFKWSPAESNLSWLVF